VNRFILPVITASTLIFGFILPSEEAVAQTTAKDLVGTWTLVSITLEQDGKKTDFYGPNPQGQRTFDPTGHFSEIITRSDLPTQHVESCTFPNWNGTERKYSFDISGDELIITPFSAPSTGTGTVHLVLKRAK
jgi:hypothetical protein